MKRPPSKQVRKDKNQSQKARSNPTLGKWNEMNRKQPREMMRKMQNEDLSLEVVHPDAAGIGKRAAKNRTKKAMEAMPCV